MKIHFSGAEVGAHRKRFAHLGIRHVAFNLGPVLNSGGHDSVAQDDLLPFVTIFYANQTVDEDEAAAVMQKHGDETSLAIGMEYQGRFKGHAIPVWDGVDVEHFRELLVDHGSVYIDEADASEKRNRHPLTDFVMRNPSVKVYCATNRVDVLELPFITDAIVTGWINTQKYRELQVWDGKKVRKLPRTSRQASVDNYLSQIMALGCDADLLREGDVDEMTKLSLMSWLQYEKIATTSTPAIYDEDEDDPHPVVAIPRQPARQRERTLLPVLEGFEMDGHHSTPVLNSNTLRRCDGCFLSGVCPMFEPGAACAYEIPAVIRTEKQRKDAQNIVHEIQFQRVLFRRMAEELQGGEPDPDTSKEMDRFFHQAEAMRRMNENRASVTISASESGSGEGILSKIFGSTVANSSKELPAPVPSNEILAESWEAGEVDSN